MKIPHFNVVIVGSGVTGLSAAYFLHKGGADKIAILNSHDIPSFSSRAANILCGGLQDNFTRISNAHGIDFAKLMWSFSHNGFDNVLRYCREYSLPFHKNRRIRLIVSESELKEAEQAVKELQSVGLEGGLYETDEFSSLGSLQKRVLAVQDDGERGAWIDTGAFLKSLKEHTAAFDIPTSLRSFERSKDGITLFLSDGSEISAEFIVLACHQQIAKFLPSLKEALVTYADQWSDVESSKHAAREEGIVFSAHHGYEWGVLKNKSLQFGGLRYLRKLAGIGAMVPSVEEKIKVELKKHLQQTFTWAEQAKFTHTEALIDIWPCDELPLIGPMFGEGRILLATGYMGTGLSLGFQAGLCLAELIRTGDCLQLPRRLWPERLRSL